MRFSRQLGVIGTFVLAAVVVYALGAALLLAWPMWAMMGFGPGWVLTLLLPVGVAAGIVWLIGRSTERAGAGPGAPSERCPHCRAAVEPDYVLCPECHTALGIPCPECRRLLRPSWPRCPYCGARATGGASRAAQSAPPAAGGPDDVAGDARGNATGVMGHGRRQ